MVTAVAPTAFTLQLRDRSMAISRDAGSPALTTGAIVEVHYVETKNARTAVEIFTDGAAGSTELSKKPGRSYRGVAGGTKRSRLMINLGQKTRQVELGARTRLLDVEGRTVATGKNDVTPLLTPGENVLVKFVEEDDSLMGGDVIIPGSKTTALEIRRLKKAL